jgi:hypothetical protein
LYLRKVQPLEGIDGRYFGIDPVRSISQPRSARLAFAMVMGRSEALFSNHGNQSLMAANGVFAEIIFENAIEIRWLRFAI